MRRVLALCAFCIAAGSAYADGFRVVQGGPSIGNAGAGSAAVAEDPATAFFNPAGLTRVADGTASHLSVLCVSTRFTNDGSSTFRGAPLTGGEHERDRLAAPVPGFFAAKRVSDDWSLGVAVTSPFGLASEYPSGWVGRYQATRTSLQTIDVAPCAAWRVAPSLSLGGGVDLQYLSADLRNAVDFGTIAAHRFDDPQGTFGLSPQKDDGRARLQGDDFAVGGNLGALWQATPQTRVGVAFRSAVRHSVEGEASFVVPRDARRLLLSGAFRDTDAFTTLTLPEVLSVGAAHDVSRDVTLLLGADWTNWSRFETLDVRFANPRQKRLVEDESWHDTIRPAAGVTWRADPRWTLRAGIAWDPATVDDAHRRPRDPDVARLSLACGASFRVSDSATLDLAFLRTVSREATIDVRAPDAGRLKGHFDVSLDYFSVAFTLDF